MWAKAKVERNSRGFQRKNEKQPKTVMKKHSRPRQHSSAKKDITTGQSTGHQGTKTHHTTQQGNTTAPQNAKRNSTAHNNAPQHQATATAETERNTKTQEHQRSAAQRHRHTRTRPNSTERRALSDNKRRGATQEEARKLSGMRLILVRVLHLAMESYWIMWGEQ